MDSSGETVRWAYRILLDREPEDERVARREFPDTRTMRRAFLLSEEFQTKNADLVFGFSRWVITETAFGFRLWVSLEEQAISRSILFGNYELPEAAFVAANVRPGDHVIDAGANIGYFTMLLAQACSPGGTVRSFEPLDYLFDALERSVAENRFTSWVVPVRVALADVCGRALFRHVPRTTNFGGGHLAEAGEMPPSHVEEPVDLRTLDSLLDERRVAFVKIDVEGAEPRAMRGARRMLERDRPVILAELHNAQLRTVSGVSATEFVAEMRTAGYGCSALTEAGQRGDAMTAYDGEAPINVVFDPLPAFSPLDRP
uniref:31-O-demethyl-FK506 methyltransferase FkbM n=1 Tax=uncultured organism TaxID=155900 RepID=A0A7L9QCU4_9ZZZZ|nr:31-O-demethyl-FK506 methyltransferase FkbM [uncultured organism]